MIDCDSFHETKSERKYYEDKKQKALATANLLLVRYKTTYAEIGEIPFAKKCIPVSSLIDLIRQIEDI